MNRRLRSRFSTASTRIALGTVAALVVTVGLTATLSGKVDRFDPEALSASGGEAYGPFAPRETLAARDLRQNRQWLPADGAADVESPGYRVRATVGLSGANIAVHERKSGDAVASFELSDLGRGDCAFGAGNAVVFHDRQADRWLLSQASRIDSTVCVYVSQTPDPAGAYFGYEIVAPGFPAQPNYEIRSDVYLASGNGTADTVYNLESTAMLAGQPARVQRAASPSRTAGAALGFSAPGFSKSFSPSTIGPGSTTTLTFDIDNLASPIPVTDLAFTDTLPAGMTIATPSSASTDCGASAILSAPDGGGTISLSDGRVGAFSSCTVVVNVTATSTGMNVSGDLTSSEGFSGTASATLTVDVSRPGFSKSFSPGSIPLGGTSRLTFLIDNSLNAALLTDLSFSDGLPGGMVVATPANVSSDCGTPPFVVPTITAVSGTSQIAVSVFGNATYPALAAGGSCTVSVDVTTDAYGAFPNTTTELSVNGGTSSGFATAVLNVPRNALNKSFVNDPVPPGGTVTLEFIVTNFDRNFPMTSIAFDDPIDPLGSLAGLAPGETLPKPACGGTLDFAAGTLSLSGGSLPAEGSCTFSVLLDVPALAPAGTYSNTTDPLTATVDGAGVILNAATDLLTVRPDPLFTKEFIDDPAGAGGAVTLRFTIANTDPTSSLTDIEFTDPLNNTIPGLAANSLVTGTSPNQGVNPLVDVCGTGSELTVPLFVIPSIPLSIASPDLLLFTGGNLAPAGSAGDSCSFDVVLDIPAGIPGGNYLNTTSNITGLLAAGPVTGLPASAFLEIVRKPRLLKEFTDDPVLPGSTVNMQFTVTHDAFASGDATGVTFTDDLAALVPAIPGLVATGLPLTDVCGPGNGTLAGSAGDTLLTFSGATLVPGQVCTFGVTLAVPAGAAAGGHTNTTSAVSATVDGVATTGNAASDTLRIASLTLTKEFLNDPVFPGANVTLRFTVSNVSPTEDATSISFLDALDPDVLLGLTATSLPAQPCGAGSTIVAGSGGGSTERLQLAGGNLLAGESCSFDVELLVPAATADGTYPNATSSFFAIVGGNAVFPDNATDDLVVASGFLALTKEFTDDPVFPGGTANLRFTLTNLDAAQAASGIGFSDNLNAALSGLVATGLPIAACGGTASSFGNTIDFLGGALAASEVCSFDVTVQVPASAPPGTVATNTTSAVTGTIGGFGVTGDPATDNLFVAGVAFSKAFTGATFPGGGATLEFTIRNLSPTESLTSLTFTDDLNAVIPGLVATGLPAANVCGAGSQLTGPSLLTLTGGNLLPGASCTFGVSLQVPATASLGRVLNVTSKLRSGTTPIAPSATASLLVEEPPGGAPRMETGTVTAGATHVPVSFVNTYLDPVVVATVHVVNNPRPVVVRVRNVTSTGFEVRLQNPSGGTPVSDKVSYWVVEQGVWVFDGVRLEAQKYLSTVVSRKGAWNAEPRAYNQVYATPVVLGQVMTENDTRWSSFFARGTTRYNPPSSTALFAGRQIGEDTDRVRADETIGYIVVEAVHTTLAGVEFEAALGLDTVLGVPNGAPFAYTFNNPFVTAPTSVVMSSAGMDGGDGAWAQGFGSPLANTSKLFLSVDEDQIGDAERSHTTEQVAYAAFAGNLVFPAPAACLIDADCDDGLFCNGVETCDAGTCLLGSNPCPGSPCDEVGDVCVAGGVPQLESVSAMAGGLAPATVNLTNTYVSPVVVCTVVYANNTRPVVPRIANVTASSFDVSLQNPGDLHPVVTDQVQCLVVEEGSWMINGNPVEAHKYNSTITDKEYNWLGAFQSLTQSFSNPVVLGQVMSRNDPLWSYYWQQGTARSTPPSGTALRNGKSVGEDPNVVRADETIGYIVFEQSNGSIGGVTFEARLGVDTIQGIGNAPPRKYTFNVPFTSAPQAVIATQAGMDGSDGSWAYLYGGAFSTPSQLSLAVDEDQIFNAERGHTTEQVGYVAFETPVVFP